MTGPPTGSERRRKLQSGTITVVQRKSSDLRLNPHLHIVALDGVFAEEQDGPARFVQLPELTFLDVAEALSAIRSRVVRLLVRRGVLETRMTGELEFAYSDDDERAPALAQLMAAAVSGLPPCRLGMPPAGPERRERAERAPLHLAHAPQQSPQLRMFGG